MFKRMTLLALAGAMSVGLGLAPAGAESVADFYKGKRISFLIPTAPGGSYHAYSQQIARHMGKHLPGNPTFTTQNSSRVAPAARATTGRVIRRSLVGSPCVASPVDARASDGR